MKRKNEKTIIGIVAALIVIIVVIIILAVSGCSDKGNSPIDDATTETRIETVTEIATDAQGNTYVEESTEVVEVIAQGDKAESSEQATSAKNENKTDDKKESSANNASSENKTNNDKNTSKTDTSTSKNSSSSKTENSKVNNSTSSNKNNSSSSSTSNKNNTSTSKPSSSSSASSTSKKTWHEAEYEYIKHPAVTEKVWVVDKEAYTYEEPIYEEQGRAICNDCGADISDDIYNHSKNHALNGGNGSYSVKQVKVQVGTKTIEVPEEGHWETKVIKEAWTEKVLVREAGYY